MWEGLQPRLSANCQASRLKRSAARPLPRSRSGRRLGVQPHPALAGEQLLHQGFFLQPELGQLRLQIGDFGIGGGEYLGDFLLFCKRRNRKLDSFYCVTNDLRLSRA
ncbi:hypothetical protein D9M68_782920 [compost metagenome]